VEVVSKSSKQSDTLTKFELYQEFGVTYYLIVDPQQRSLVLNLLHDKKYEEVALQSLIQINDCQITLEFSGVFD